MQNDSESVPEGVLRALVADGQTAAPGESRARVLARLGVAAAAGAAALAHGSIASAAAGKAAGHSAAPAAASVLGFGVAKALIAHPVIGIVATLVVGSGVGIGTYHAFEPAPTPPPVIATPKTASKSKYGPDRSVALLPPAPNAPVAPAPEASSELVPEARTETPPQEARAANAPNAPAAKRAEPAELVPAPELPLEAASARLAEQQTLLDQARVSLRRGDGAGALAILAGHESLYPVTEFAEERAAIGILALVMSGRSDAARDAAERFRARFPTSLFLPAIEKSLAPMAPPLEPAAHD